VFVFLENKIFLMFLKDVIVEFLTNPSFRLNEIDAEVPDVSDKNVLIEILQQNQRCKDLSLVY